ncbi:TetR/AcrR family transcriptional regulator [Actinoplanes siamensis]|uniref:TetR family transcriptional regulator n=1 Tax=Actinoplanes siamensis TaxID=1223317 RepID=A0A919N757_9ACTN|nr:TetR family transcriptional regulator [Actinoplanes siamensis]GIF05566.1 TetR family transcriptional regulator [Actinoplanes siamensis]
MAEAGTESGRRLRADAEKNRRRLLTIARAALDADGDATMKAIARAAGVGQGTIYRHFPTRGALLVEVYQDEFADLLAASRTLADARPPVEALRAWLDHLAAFGRRKRALAQALDAATQAELHHQQYDRTMVAIDMLLSRGIASGELREDARAGDLIALASFLWHLETASDPRITRLLDLVVDAFRRH